jgi:hypothetical protein
VLVFGHIDAHEQILARSPNLFPLAHLHFWIVLKRWGARGEKFSMENGVDIGRFKLARSVVQRIRPNWEWKKVEISSRSWVRIRMEQ